MASLASGGGSALRSRGDLAAPPAWLVHQLGTEYPGLPAAAVAQAVDRAAVAAAALWGGSTVAAEQVAVLARDRLDVLRERRAAAAALQTRHPRRGGDATSGGHDVLRVGR